MKKAVTQKKSSNPLMTRGAGIAVLVFLFLLAVFVLPPATTALIENYLSKTTGLPVKIGKIHLSLTRSQFSIKDLRFSNSKGFPAALLARVGKVKIHYLPPATFGGWFELKKVEINFEEFRLVRNEAGTLNLPALRPLPAKGETINELVLNLGPLTYTDLSGTQPVQQTFDLKLQNAVYRNVKGVPGIFEILNWEVLKRTGVEEKTTPTLPPLPEIKPAGELKPLAPQPQAPSPPSSAASKPEESSPPAK